MISSDVGRALARLIPYGERMTFPRGVDLMAQGDLSEALYVILEGRVSVLRSHEALQEPLLLAILGPGEVVGEMGLLEGQARSATVRAVEDTIVVKVDAEAVSRCAFEHPEVSLALLRVLSSRLRIADELAARLRAAGGGRPA